MNHLNVASDLFSPCLLFYSGQICRDRNTRHAAQRTTETEMERQVRGDPLRAAALVSSNLWCWLAAMSRAKKSNNAESQVHLQGTSTSALFHMILEAQECANRLIRIQQSNTHTHLMPGASVFAHTSPCRHVDSLMCPKSSKIFQTHSVLSKLNTITAGTSLFDGIISIIRTENVSLR